jgi:hypothetical protein
MTLVYLTLDQMDWGERVGIQRHEEAVAAGRRDRREEMPAEVSIANHVLGARGELAGCIALGFEWEARINNFEGADAGRKTQMRTRRGHKSELIVRPENADDQFYVLITNEESNPRLFIVHGWILGRDAKLFPKKNPRGIHPAHFISRKNLSEHTWPDLLGVFRRNYFGHT